MRNKITWSDITLRTFNEMQSVLNDDDFTDEEKVAKLCVLVYGDFPLGELGEKSTELVTLLKSDLNPSKSLPNEITINDRKYSVTKDISRLTTSQFMDYQEYCKDADNVDKMLSVFLIPDGHKYNDGYNVTQVMEDMNDVPITIVRGYVNFFHGLLKKSILHFQTYLIVLILMKKEMSWKQKKSLIQEVKTYCQSMDSLISFMGLLKKQV